jgi:hypothetical protein
MTQWLELADELFGASVCFLHREMKPCNFRFWPDPACRSELPAFDPLEAVATGGSRET